MNSVCPVVSFAHVLGMWMTRVYVFPLYRVVHYKQKTEKKKKNYWKRNEMMDVHSVDLNS